VCQNGNALDSFLQHKSHIQLSRRVPMDSLSNGPNRLSVREKQDRKAEIKTPDASVSGRQKICRHLPLVISRGGHARGRRGCTITLSGLSVRHIVALCLVSSSVAWSIGAIMALVFAALGLFPASLAAALFFKSGSVFGVAWFITHSRRR